MAERRILLADRNETHVEWVRRAMDRVGVPCHLNVVQDGTEVVNYLFVPDWQASSKPELPDLILLDLNLPKMDGLHVLQVLRRVRGQDHTRLPPVIVLTASGEDRHVADAYRLGGRSYVCKPTDEEGFVVVVGELLRYWLLMNRPIPTCHVSMEFLSEGL